ncbi:hypothetical protein CDAR_78001 [Caerostris darwini]|uniref:Uncharacterized protein n=1 Tax=Caerostris darwini TaxID=1538125 RepID=A0AAV4RKH8_9ARAC|nr:hypothetical protein CDAR_78001 [Caerostris darwini]
MDVLFEFAGVMGVKAAESLFRCLSLGLVSFLLRLVECVGIEFGENLCGIRSGHSDRIPLRDTTYLSREILIGFEDTINWLDGCLIRIIRSAGVVGVEAAESLLVWKLMGLRFFFGCGNRIGGKFMWN